MIVRLRLLLKVPVENKMQYKIWDYPKIKSIFELTYPIVVEEKVSAFKSTCPQCKRSHVTEKSRSNVIHRCGFCGEYRLIIGGE